MAVAAVSPAAATIVPIAVYSQVTSGSTTRWVRAANGHGGQLFTISSQSSTTPGSATVNFNFLKPVLSALGPISASFSMSAATSAIATQLPGFLAQQPLSGSFAFTYNGATPLVVGHTSYATGANLLSGTFTGATIVGQTGGTSGTFTASTSAGSLINLASDLLDFSNAANFDFAISLSAMSTQLATANASSALNSFRTSTGGSFGSDASALTAPVPEPESWALMVAGFGALGFALRRRRRKIVAA